MEEKLWKPIGMEADGSWSLDSKRSSFEKLESGVNARARDFARFGMLFAKEGRNWDGERLISRSWVEESTRADATTNPSFEYQYFWWVDTPDGKDHFSARGKYGQYIYVTPEKNLVIVRLGKEEGERGYEYWIELIEVLTTRLETSAKNRGSANLDDDQESINSALGTDEGVTVPATRLDGSFAFAHAKLRLRRT